MASSPRPAHAAWVEPLSSPLHPRSPLTPLLALAPLPRGARSSWESMWASGSDAWAHPAARSEEKERRRRRGEERREEERSGRRGDARHSCCRSTESCRTLRWFKTPPFVHLTPSMFSSLSPFYSLHQSLLRMQSLRNIKQYIQIMKDLLLHLICWARTEALPAARIPKSKSYSSYYYYCLFIIWLFLLCYNTMKAVKWSGHL